MKEIAIASAGSGKTYQLSTRLVALLAAGVPPERILASTFTRKAAGEILERVLLRLAEGALDPGAASALADSFPPWASGNAVRTPEGCRTLLADLAPRLHRLQVHTLDAFLHRAVRAFAMELGLPGRWTVADEAAAERLHQRAIERVLEGFGPDRMAALLRGVGKGAVRSSVHRGLLDSVTALHREFRSFAPGAEDAWGFPDGETRFPPVDPAAWSALADRVLQLELPRNKGNGAVPANWQGSIETITTGLRTLDAAAVLKTGLVKNAVLEPKEAYARHPIPEDTRELLHQVVEAIARHELHLLDRKARDMGAFMARYHVEVEGLRREEGLYGFDDLAFALLGGGAMEHPEELYYRLDGEIRHLLLDEFQDTSVVQWRTLEPLVSELLSGYEGERAVYLVGDPKQSIYGWRGGEPRILDGIAERYPLKRSSLSRSWRSSPVLLDLVNRVFGTLRENPAFDREEEREGVEAWSAGFESHEPEWTRRPGRWTVEVGPDGSDRADGGDEDEEDEEAASPGERETKAAALLRVTAERAATLIRELPGAAIGVLVRRHADGAAILAHLRAQGVEASGEGGVPLVDSAPVLAILALLRLADHPGDSASRYLVSHTALGAAEGLPLGATEEEARMASVRIRRRLLEEGYGAVVGAWARSLQPAEGDRDRERLRQLAEFAARWEERATLRTMDFVRAAARERRDLPGGGGVRVMTIHASKGLQFDAVLLPETGSSWRKGRGPEFLAVRDDPTGPVLRLLPAVPRSLRDHVPEAARAGKTADLARLRDDLSSLYVAMTRARYALHVFIPPDGKGVAGGLSGARILRCALREDGERAEPETRWAEGGDPDWWDPVRTRDPGERAALTRLRRPPPPPPAVRRPVVSLAPSPRRRLLERATPSGLEGGDRVRLDRVLRRPARHALERGTLVHRWMEEIEWLPGEGPGALDAHAFLRLAREVAPGFDGAEALFETFRGWLSHPGVAEWLRADAWPEGTRAERELPFLVRSEAKLLQGVADRVLRVPDPDGDRLVVVDWKTDPVSSATDPLFEERVALYRPQLAAYRRAVARMERVPEERVAGWLVFVPSGVRSAG